MVTDFLELGVGGRFKGAADRRTAGYLSHSAPTPAVAHGPFP
jgi:hypothetical protein